MVPAYLLNSVLGLGMALLADPVSESVFVHLGVSALLGLFSIVLFVAFVVNNVLRTFRSLQPVRRPCLITQTPSAASASILMGVLPRIMVPLPYLHALPHPSIVCASSCLLV